MTPAALCTSEQDIAKIERPVVLKIREVHKTGEHALPEQQLLESYASDTEAATEAGQTAAAAQRAAAGPLQQLSLVLPRLPPPLLGHGPGPLQDQ